jgi:hypothetical protein
MIPNWLHSLSIAYLLFGAICAAVIAFDLTRHPQQMWIMNVVWPVTALFGTAWILWQYLTHGRLATRRCGDAVPRRSAEPKADPFSRHRCQRHVALRRRLHAGRHLRRMVGIRGSFDSARLWLTKHL